jgi:antirestriction protein ArdC
MWYTDPVTSKNQLEKKMKASIYQRITNKLIAILESGANPWQRDWTLGNGGGYGMPHNAISGRAYRGINLMLLTAEQIVNGYQSTGWITKGKLYELAKADGVTLNWKGQSPTEVVLWKRSEKKDSATGERSSYMWAKTFWVWNLDQIDGIEDCADKLKGYKALEIPEEIADTHALVAAVSKGLDIKVNHGGDRAFYNPGSDFIQMPPKDAFKSEAGYLGTFMHESTHATGHKSRCDRGVKAMQGRFGTEAYAFEELVAELGSCFLQGTLGIEMHTENHASYLANWLKVLKDDEKAIFTAASKAQKACDYILDKTGIKEMPVYDTEETDKKRAA